MNKMCVEALIIAEKYYSKKKLQHAIRVANYASEIANIDYRMELEPYLTSDHAFTVGILHDILEDTTCL
jgi:HD superfamily phosphohydrolase YqeK